MYRVFTSTIRSYLMSSLKFEILEFRIKNTSQKKQNEGEILVIKKYTILY